MSEDFYGSGPWYCESCGAVMGPRDEIVPCACDHPSFARVPKPKPKPEPEPKHETSQTPEN